MIKFGTSGWRAIMGEDFTFRNVRIVVQAVADHLTATFPDRPIAVVVNYDTRFLSEKFASEAARILSLNRIHAFLADRDAPSQAQAFQILRRGAQGGINFTASFNPPEYNGLKFNVETGAPALPQVTSRIEKAVQSLQDKPLAPVVYPRQDFIEKIDLKADYLAFIQNKVDFDLIRRSRLKVAVDLLFGTSREYLDGILEDNGIPIEEIHGYVDPYFGGVIPSCTEENLRELRTVLRSKRCQLGVATDADGDRFGILDHKGNLVAHNIIISLLLDYLARVRKLRGGVARSVATTHLVDRIARAHDLPLHKTPVGFKYLADLFLRGEIVFGAEESACMAIKDHLPEKDGIYAGLLVAEMVAASGRNLVELQADLFERYGRREDGQKNIVLTPERARRLRKLIRNPPARLDGRRVVGVETIDGVKLDFDNDDWLLLRFSGTEPLIRCYAEADTRKEMERLMKRGLEKLA